MANNLGNRTYQDNRDWRNGSRARCAVGYRWWGDSCSRHSSPGAYAGRQSPGAGGRRLRGAASPEPVNRWASVRGRLFLEQWPERYSWDKSDSLETLNKATIIHTTPYSTPCKKKEVGECVWEAFKRLTRLRSNRCTHFALTLWLQPNPLCRSNGSRTTNSC